ncbi:site-specific DNA-methyltransferase [Ligilactobacillus aviarius]|uniref:site-specific DNA-methyltransferase n=1 Tax=Ligilactobacillus aviarius TaxID=1606 RepID=UPI00320A3251
MEVIAVIRDHLQENENVKPNTAFLEELRSKLPNFFENGDFNFNAFKDALKENNVKEFSDGYQLSFIGKDYARKQAGNAPTSVIVPDNEHNQKEENKNSKNLFFTGDNLEVLRHLRNNYSNKVDVIYIDPPYNTGNDDFVYPDKFEYSDKQLEEVFGMTKDDVSKLDALKGSRSHSAWLTFMYPRLWLAKQLLTDDGVIFISIDDNEQANLKLLMDEIYGETNFLGEFSVENNPKGRKNSKYIAVSSEYVISYSKNFKLSYFNENIPKKKADMKLDENGRYVHNSGKRVLVGENTFNNEVLDIKSSKNYSVYYEANTNKLEIIQEKSLDDKDQQLIKAGYKRYVSSNNGKLMENTYSKEKFSSLYQNKELEFSKNKIYEKNFKDTKRIKSQIHNEDYEAIIKGKLDKYKLNVTTTNAKQYLKKLFDVNYDIFSNPKNVQLIKLLLTLIEKDDTLVLDFFAGSATTADAVMQLNAEDGGNRKFIMVQLPEKTYVEKNKKKIPTKGGKAAFEAGYESIDEISRERIKRAAKKIKDENPDLSEDFDGGFKHYRVVSPEKETLDKIYDFDPENYELVSDMVESFSSSALGVSGNASGEDTILTTWLAEDGYDFNTHNLVEYDFAGYKTFGIKDTRLYLIDNNWHSEQTKELLNQLGTNKVKFQSVVVYGYSFNVMDMKELDRGLLQLNSKVELIKRY